MSNIGSYEDRLKGSSWEVSARELGYKEGGVINIAWYCTDRICEMGQGLEKALIWEGHAGEEKRYTYNDIRLASNTVGAFLKGLGGHRKRGPGLPVHGQDPRALPGIPRDPEDGRHRTTAFLGLRRDSLITRLSKPGRGLSSPRSSIPRKSARSLRRSQT